MITEVRLSTTATVRAEMTMMKVITEEKTLTAEIREKKCEHKLRKSSVSKMLMMLKNHSSIKLMCCFKTEI